MKRIIKLTEQDLYRIVKKVIKEQIKTEKVGKSQTFNISGNWDAGYYSYNKLPDLVKKDFEVKLKEISKFLVQNPNSDITLTIEVGESQLPNYDKEKNKKLETGDLAKLRGESIKQKIEVELDLLEQQGSIKSRPKVDIKAIIGSTEYNKEDYQKKCGSNPNSTECINLRNSFKKDQFVRIQISVKTKGECIGNLRVSIEYNRDKHLTKFPTTHYCNEGIFKILLNNIWIGTANLNNKGDNNTPKENVPGLYQKVPMNLEKNSKDRKCTWKLDTETASEILTKNQNSITLSIQGINVKDRDKGVHADVPYVTIERYDTKTNKYVFVYKGFPNVKLERGSEKVTILGTLDACATKVISGFQNNEI